MSKTNSGRVRLGLTSRARRAIVQFLALLAAFAALQAFELAASTPLWLFSLLTAALVVASNASAAVGPGGWKSQASLAVRAGLAVAVLYATGWGAPLALALAYLIVDQARTTPAPRTAWYALVWCVAAIAAGQIAVAGGLAPTLVSQAQAHGLAVVAGLGLGAIALRVHRLAPGPKADDDHADGAGGRLASLLRHCSDLVIVLDEQRTPQYMSPAAESMLGRDPAELVQESLLALFPDEDAAEMEQLLAGLGAEPRKAVAPLTTRMRHDDGSWRHVEVIGHSLPDGAVAGRFVVTVRDIAERRELEDQLTHRAFHDSLTNLANRALFTDRVGHAIARQNRTGAQVAVLFIDLDGFKDINDTLGHATGDELLLVAAERLQLCARDTDTVARLGGDEFGVLLEDIRDESSPARYAERALRSLSEPFTVSGREVTITASIGIAVGGGEESSEELMRNADIAMYMAKGTGKNRFEIFEPSMHVAVVQRLEFEASIERALQEEEFVLHYQPIVKLDSGRIVGIEALVRWNHPERGMVPPGDFIPVAEETGTIVDIGRWVLNEACHQVAEWQRRFPTSPPLHVSVNLSPRQLLYADISADVRRALDESGIEPSTLTLEITETALVQDTELTITQLHQLKQLGVRLAIDDFGTGYSSLSYLQRFPVDVLKIDRSFIDSLDRDANPALVRAIVELGNTLQLDTIAEGIERDEQLDQFRALRCRHGQGFFFARPADSQSINELFSKQGWADGTALAEVVLPGQQDH